MISIIFAFIMMVVSAYSVSAEEILVSRFATEGLKGWESKSFKSQTQYNLMQDANRTVVHATSQNSASGLVRKIHFMPIKYRYLRWSWKIAHTISGGDARTKGGDDYAARIYVIFPGNYFWQMKGINYVWGNKLPKGESVSSPYTPHSKMIAVESGGQKAGQWVTEEVDIFADYKRLFGENPGEADAIAIMTDTDNTGGLAEAWYGDIVLSTTR